MTLTYCDSNGGVEIVSFGRGKSVKFSVGKYVCFCKREPLLTEDRYGAGGDGELTVEVPFESCLLAFTAAVNWRRNFVPRY